MRRRGSPAHVLFGRALRPTLAVWVLRRQNPRFYLSEAQAAVPPQARSAVASELESLESIGMLKEERGRGGDRRRWFRRTTSPLWRIIETADEVLSSEQV
jgi:hypothetical protein